MRLPKANRRVDMGTIIIGAIAILFIVALIIYTVRSWGK